MQNGTDGKNKQNANTSCSAAENKQDGHINKKMRILEKITYDDLDASNDNTNTGQQLNLSKVAFLFFFKNR